MAPTRLHRPDADPAVAYLVARHAPIDPTPAAGACPDANLLAAHAEGRLLREEEARVGAHVASCAECAAIVDAVRAEMEAVPAGRRRFAPWLLAAALLVLVSLAAVLLTREAGRDPEARLAAALRDVARQSPETFAGFTLLGRDERLARGEEARRGGVVLLAPSGTVLEERPAFRWEPLAGAEAIEVRVLRADGTPLFKVDATGTELPYPGDQPALVAGRYLWRITARSVMDTESGGRVFEVASAPAREAAARALAAIDAHAPADLRELLRAHFALRHEIHAEALRAARAQVAVFSEDPLTLETLLCALRRMGASEARAVERRLGALIPEAR